MQLNAEEAFFRVHPNGVIEYRLYDSREQFEAMLMMNPDFDVAIVGGYMVDILGEKGGLQSLDELGINEYPQTLLDYEDELSCDGKLMGLPQSVAQSYWTWNASAARKAGLTNPAPDGAGRPKAMLRIALPLLRPVTLFGIIYLAMNGLRIFRESYLLCGKYPPKNLYFIQNYVNNHFSKLDYSLLSAGSTLFALIVTVAFAVIWLLLGRKDGEAV